jgi:hypothetical protein
MSEENTGYLYRHVRLDTNEVFYVGISISNENKKYYRAYNKFDRTDFWKKVAAKTEYRVDILLDNIPYKILLKKEQEFIKRYGRRNMNEGTLVNLTDGGEGCVRALKPMGERQRLAMIGKKRPKEIGEKISKALKGVPKPPEHMIKLQKAAQAINEKRKKKIIQKTMSGDIVKIWESNHSCMHAGYCRGSIIKCCKGIKESYRKYKWEYYEKE